MDKQHESLIAVYKDMLDGQKRVMKMMFAALIASLVCNLCIVGAFLLYESGFEYEKTTTTQTVDGAENSIVNGDQFNDESQDNGGE